eukprot:9907373-Lingulodinium_polyedra.AAC.1
MVEPMLLVVVLLLLLMFLLLSLSIHVLICVWSDTGAWTRRRVKYNLLHERIASPASPLGKTL